MKKSHVGMFGLRGRENTPDGKVLRTCRALFELYETSVYKHRRPAPPLTSDNDLNIALRLVET